jgi:hypothetical protein
MRFVSDNAQEITEWIAAAMDQVDLDNHALWFLTPKPWDAGAYRKIAADCIEIANGLDGARSHWTTQPPTEPGWYWFKGGSGEVDVVEVWLPKGGTTLLASDSNATYEPASMEGTWYSEPLSVPGPNA